MPNICWICGEPATAHYEMYRAIPEILERYEPGEYMRARDIAFTECHQREYCEKCFKEVDEQHKANVNEYVRLKAILMHERAVRSLEHQKAKLLDYKEAINDVREYMLEKPEKIESSQEALAAIILIHNRIETKVQYHVGKYRVDFFLPELMTCLEIDGELHRTKKTYDSNRDAEIKQMLGEGYDVVRIPTKYIDQNAQRLVDAIKQVRIERITGKTQPIKKTV